MSIFKFKSFEDAERFEAGGKGISRRFTPDRAHIESALAFTPTIQMPPGLYRFETFHEAQAQAMRARIRLGNQGRTR
jgi:hypothetical protein